MFMLAMPWPYNSLCAIAIKIIKLLSVLSPEYDDVRSTSTYHQFCTTYIYIPPRPLPAKRQWQCPGPSYQTYALLVDLHQMPDMGGGPA